MRLALPKPCPALALQIYHNHMQNDLKTSLWAQARLPASTPCAQTSPRSNPKLRFIYSSLAVVLSVSVSPGYGDMKAFDLPRFNYVLTSH